MPTITRIVQPYYEEPGFYAVSKDRTEDVFGNALNILANHVGTIVMREALPKDLSIFNQTLLTSAVRFGAEQHSALLSGRYINATKADKKIPPGGRCYYWQERAREHSRVFVHLNYILKTRDPKNLIAATIATHEFGHSFGLQHCSQEDCLMQPQHPNSLEWAKKMLISDMFCRDCTDLLAIRRPNAA
ncbi:MAG: matrixin family metalloprotease [Candidatus Saccharimonadales bacterium]